MAVNLEEVLLAAFILSFSVSPFLQSLDPVCLD